MAQLGSFVSRMCKQENWWNECVHGNVPLVANAGLAERIANCRGLYGALPSGCRSSVRAARIRVRLAVRMQEQHAPVRLDYELHCCPLQFAHAPWFVACVYLQARHAL